VKVTNTSSACISQDVTVSDRASHPESALRCRVSDARRVVGCVETAVDRRRQSDAGSILALGTVD
jgi:hypothetical protein